MRETTGAPGAEVGINAPMFACHKSGEGAEEACAGWLAAAGSHHLGVRIALMTGRLPVECVEPRAGWPALHGSYEEMMAAKAHGIPIPPVPVDAPSGA